MGGEQSAVDYSASIPIPANLRPIYPFLFDANRFLRNLKKDPRCVANRKRVALSCINHAYKLLLLLNIEFDAEAKECLQRFIEIRNCLGKDLNISLEPVPQCLAKQGDGNAIASHDILLAEADSILALADELLNEHFRFDAMLYYHTACVFYRVLMSMIPSLAGVVHSKLVYAAAQSKMTSPATHNLVLEHFTDTSCADVYEVHGASKLGKGSYGSVYLATHRVTANERAVKVMNVDRVTSYYLRKLHTEISVLRAIDHPNIIKLQDVFFGRRSVYLVTDLCRGGELFELLNSGKSQGFVFREDRASQLMRDMISAVHYLHSQGIVHRDLKLENFLFESKTASSPLVLIDFGLSKFFEPEEKMNQRVGSCYYTAPEVLNGNYDERCDNWSLGVLCYMLLTGTPPFYGKSVDEVYAATLNQEPVFADKKFRHVSACCLDFIKRLLVKDPERRMTSGEALMHPFITGLVPPVTTVLSPNPNPMAYPPGVSSSGSGPALSTRGRSESGAGSDASAGTASGGIFGSWNLFSSSSNLQASASGSSPVMPGGGAMLGGQSQQQVIPLQSNLTHSGAAIDGGMSAALTKRAVLPIDIASTIVECLKLFAETDPLTRVALTMVAHKLSPEATADLRRVFQSLDPYHTGQVSMQDLQSSLICIPAVAQGVLELEYLVAMTRVSSVNGVAVGGALSPTLKHAQSMMTPQPTIGMPNATLRKSPSMSLLSPTPSSASMSQMTIPTGPAWWQSRSACTSPYLMNTHLIQLSYLGFLSAMIFNRIEISDDRLQHVFSTLEGDRSGNITCHSLRASLGGDVEDVGLSAILASADWDNDGLVNENDFLARWRQYRRQYGGRGVNALVESVHNSGVTLGGGLVGHGGPPIPHSSHHRTASGGKGIAMAMKTASHQRQLSSGGGRVRTVPQSPGQYPSGQHEPMDLI